MNSRAGSIERSPKKGKDLAPAWGFALSSPRRLVCQGTARARAAMLASLHCPPPPRSCRQSLIQIHPAHHYAQHAWPARAPRRQKCRPAPARVGSRHAQMACPPRAQKKRAVPWCSRVCCCYHAAPHVPDRHAPPPALGAAQESSRSAAPVLSCVLRTGQLLRSQRPHVRQCRHRVAGAPAPTGAHR